MAVIALMKRLGCLREILGENKSTKKMRKMSDILIYIIYTEREKREREQLTSKSGPHAPNDLTVRPLFNPVAHCSWRTERIARTHTDRERKRQQK